MLDTDHIYSHADFRPIRPVGYPRERTTAATGLIPTPCDSESRPTDLANAGLGDRIRAMKLRDAVANALQSGPKSASEISQFHTRGIGNGRKHGAGGTVKVGEIRSVIEEMIAGETVRQYDVPSVSCRRGISTLYELTLPAC